MVIIEWEAGGNLSWFPTLSFFKMPSKTSIAFLLNPVTEPELWISSAIHTHLHNESSTSPAYRFSMMRPRLDFITFPAFKETRVMAEGEISPLKKSKTSYNSAPHKSTKSQLCRKMLSSPLSTSSSTENSDHEHNIPQKPTKTTRRRVRVRIPTPCTVMDCSNFIVTRGLCVKHGGGARCEYNGCEKRAKMHKRCFQHGGYRHCLYPDCTSKAKRYGYCWGHGGGIACSSSGCDKIATQGGLCWAHGGGSRCRFEGCTRRSYQKDEYLCSHHIRRSNV